MGHLEAVAKAIADNLTSQAEAADHSLIGRSLKLEVRDGC